MGLLMKNGKSYTGKVEEKSWIYVGEVTSTTATSTTSVPAPTNAKEILIEMGWKNNGTSPTYSTVYIVPYSTCSETKNSYGIILHQQVMLYFYIIQSMVEYYNLLHLLLQLLLYMQKYIIND